MRWLALVALGLFGCSRSDAPASPSASVASGAAISSGTAGTAGADAASPSIYGLTVKRLDGTDVQLSAWSGKVLLIVNTASECGYTPQYKGLEALQTKLESRGFSVLGFPANDFGDQEPGQPEEIAAFCRDKYGVTFPLFAKTTTVGDRRSPLYALLGKAEGSPKWNFHKYLIDKKGRPVQAWPSAVEPESPEIASAIDRELAAP